MRSSASYLHHIVVRNAPLQEIRIAHPGASGWCCDCKKMLKGDELKARMLPATHPATEICPDAFISFIKLRYNGFFGGLRECALICFDCGMKYPNEDGWWKGENTSS